MERTAPENAFFSSKMPSQLEGLCPHLDVCNGCPRMSEDYMPVQYVRKREMIQNTLTYYVAKELVKLVPAHALSFYRNRADYWYGPEKILGFRQKENRYKSFDARHCQLISPRAQLAYEKIVHQLKEMDFEPYSVLDQKGFLRYVVFRESKTDQKLVVIITTFSLENKEKIDALANNLIQEGAIDGFVWMHHPEFNDSVDGKVHQEWGETLLSEKMSDIIFEYDAKCFFQTNPKMAEKLQEYVLSRIENVSHSTKKVLDLYCGVGLFSIPLAKKNYFIKGIELGEESIQFAQNNREKNKISSETCIFETGNVPKALQVLEKNNEEWSQIILDPPRSGLSKKIWRRILRLKPVQLVYVSCNLTALKRDLEWLEEYATFEIVHSTGFDLFPHTDHVETVVDIRIIEIKEFPKGG